MVYKGEKFISCIGTNYKCPESGMIDYVLLNLAISQFSLICSGIKQPLWNVLHGYQINFGLSVVRSVSTDMCNL